MRAYLQLLRLPNVFTAMADILLGFLLTHPSLDPWPQFALLLGASCSIYLAGMVLNDYFDQEQDARERPGRPIPSGRVSPASARRLGFGLLLLGMGLGWGASWTANDLRAGAVATLLAAAVILYDAVLKKTQLAPLAMGLCRTLNVLLGMSLSIVSWQRSYLIVAGAIGLYIVGVTRFARTEARRSSRPQLVLGAVVSIAGIALLATLPRWASGAEWPVMAFPERWHLFWLVIGVLAAWRFSRAIADPTPQSVQMAVRQGIISLVVIDAGACLAVQEPFWGFVIAALLIPTLSVGRWIYST
jgi:4-hydroxybenzoate polyprenyltransferase